MSKNAITFIMDQFKKPEADAPVEIAPVKKPKRAKRKARDEQ